MIEFAQPAALLLLPLPIICYILLPAAKGLHGDALRVPFIDDLQRINTQNKGWWSGVSSNSRLSWRFLGLYFIWILLCLSAMRPIIMSEEQRLPSQGRDIMLVLDISTSMLERDFAYQGRRIDRLSAVKMTVADFVQKRADDRIGLILFGTRAYLQSPLTYDKAAVKDILYAMQAGMAGDSTSIGDALALALKNMRSNGNPQNKVIILLTDGENNDGSLSMLQAIKLAQDEGIKVYTIGVGSPDLFSQMLSLAGLSGVDETELKALAEATKARYFRAAQTGLPTYRHSGNHHL